MKPQHIQIRIEQCLALAKASHCPRRKLAAMLINPKRNVVLADGYNGGPRGAVGTLCKGHWCERDGLRREDIDVVEGTLHVSRSTGVCRTASAIVVKRGTHTLRAFAKTILDSPTMQALQIPECNTARGQAETWATDLVGSNPPIKSGTHMEKGCHHAEMNVICNAAAGGVQTTGAWMIVLAEPCTMCAKMIHHAGITKVIVVDGGYVGGKTGIKYLRAHGVKVQEIKGPKDPRLEPA